VVFEREKFFEEKVLEAFVGNFGLYSEEKDLFSHIHILLGGINI